MSKFCDLFPVIRDSNNGILLFKPFGMVLLLFWLFTRQFCPPLLGLFRLVPGFVEIDQVVP
jgi:hypothetical protein